MHPKEQLEQAKEAVTTRVYSRQEDFWEKWEEPTGFMDSKWAGWKRSG